AELDQIKKERVEERLKKASLSVHRPNTFKNLLSEDSVYELNTFDSSCAIRFIDKTVFVELVELAETLNGSRGRASGFGITNNLWYYPTRLLIYHVSTHKVLQSGHTPCLCSHSNVCLSVFADLDRLLDANLLWSCDEPKVVVAININPKLLREQN
ncbi:hypothetical protein HID58_049245, partial [Brassica napus]